MGNIFQNLSTVFRLTASYKQNRETEVVPIEETLSFFTCYRMLIETYRLAPDTAEAQLAIILKRVKDAGAAAPPSAGGRLTASIQAGGPNP